VRREQFFQIGLIVLAAILVLWIALLGLYWRIALSVLFIGAAAVIGLRDLWRKG